MTNNMVIIYFFIKFNYTSRVIQSNQHYFISVNNERQHEGIVLELDLYQLFKAGLL